MSAGKDENCSDVSRRVVNDLQVDGNARCFSSRLDDPLKPCVSWCVRVCERLFQGGRSACVRAPLCGLVPFLSLRHSHAESLHAPLQQD